MIVDTEAAMRFLRTAYEPDDWIALFLKSYESGRTMQRVGPLSLFLEPRVHAWLRAMNAQRFNVYVSVNAIRAGVRVRTKQAIGTVRHVFVEADENGPAVVTRIGVRRDLPAPSYLIHSSPDRVHVLWRASGFTASGVERVQKHLATELGTDPAATPSSQTTRLPGYLNHKYTSAHLITAEYLANERHTPNEFPSPPHVRPFAPRLVPSSGLDAIERARRYLARVEPAVAGQHGDLHTFKVCCRLARGFALSDDAALVAVTDWNRRCRPPWTEKELRDKLARARQYGRESVGALR